MRKLSYTLLATLLLFACGKAPEQKPTTPLVIKTASSGDVRFNVEVAQTPAELQKGLMHRTEMPNNNGMIFIFDPIRPVQMWMKNTKLSLDMLFVAGNGKIVMIKEKATPMSTDRISCKEPVRAVIELNAGQVSRHNIQIGDTINHKSFDDLLTIKDAPAKPKINESEKIGKANGPVIPKGPKAIGKANGQIIPKGPKAIGKANGPIIPKGPKAIGKQQAAPSEPIVPVAPPM